ncbi:MAG TPA: low molecular weight protein arginine phosphatase [bacterium]|nr:low molecular weight protein arginine phosphatase [bacterium]HOL47779.1 low molecular weight protein arginine phosphatase [bacterium]HPQ18294.1 low molecular weight protein arginine phosphatase [bacterium]
MVRKILFVCTGNTCRSPMAQFYFTKKIKELNIKDVSADSAGIYCFNISNTLSPNTIEVLKEIGINAENYKPKNITDEMLINFDLILTMSNSHKELLVKYCPEHKDKIFTLVEFSCMDNEIKEIDDPFGGSIETYRKTLNIICKCIDKLIKELKLLPE